MLSSSSTSTETDIRRTRLAGGGATHLSSHARHPRPATSDTTEGSQALARPTASKRVSSPPGREPPFSGGRHRRAESQQQASKRQRLRRCRGGPPLAAEGYRVRLAPTLRHVVRRVLLPREQRCLRKPDQQNLSAQCVRQL